MVYLTGRIDVMVREARGLPNLDNSIFHSNNKSDPYCVIDLLGINGSRRLGKTPTIDDCLNPKWDHRITIDLREDVDKLKFTVKDRDLISSEVIGSCYIHSFLFIKYTKPYNALLHLTSPQGHSAGSLRVQIRFTGMDSHESRPASFPHKVALKGQNMKTKLMNSMSKTSQPMLSAFTFLHGSLKIFVDKAVNLPNLDTSVLSLRKGDVSDPYIDILMEDGRKDFWKVATTSVKDNNLNPVWQETFEINVCHQVVAVKFLIKDKDVLSADIIGSVIFRADDIIAKKEIKGSFEIYSNGKPRKNCLLTLSILYINKDSRLAPEVPGCFYPMRKLNNVTLYQDAHCVGLPPLLDLNGRGCSQPRAWLDLHNAVVNAKEFIYIIGWSVNAKISLLRWDKEDNRCIGEILLQKAEEGVQIIIMVWDELTSTGINKDGTMGTSDEATAEFFKNTKVKVILASRERHTKDVSTKEKFTNFCYTHHQKCVLVDGSVGEQIDKRQLIAFIGGLDLTGGRFDTPQHSLFETLTTDHKNDFYNKICLTKSKYGPRQPWHDIHCRIEGPAAVDLLTNFKQRWQKQGRKTQKKEQLIADEEKLKMNNHCQDRWNVQIFRSINSDSAAFEWQKVGLRVKKERVFDSSIQRAYIHNIRRCKRFLYFENQYFMGSSHEWLESRDARIENLVPLEIIAHIEEKIAAKERFSAYILVPMFPEGKPTDKVIQEILYWQFRTMEMMYDRIANALRNADVNAHPQDYLLFLCLGKKEYKSSVTTPTELTGQGANAFKHRRLMIYVHSKMAIFDDEYIIIGSANINDRSLNGNRDTELAMGAFQPKYTTDGERLPNGVVSRFRKSLWLEHMGGKAPVADDPSRLKCIKKVKELAEEGLISFIDESGSEAKRHLLIYPLQVDYNGRLTARPDCPVFPDTFACVSGKRSGYIPTRLTS